MKNRFIKTINLLTVILLIACSHKEKNLSIVSRQFSSVKVIFPDTVYRDKVNKCTINYRGYFDTITTSFYDSHRRYIYFYFHNSNKNFSNSEFEKLPHDTIGADNNRIITISRLKFLKLGTYYIDGIIKDMIFLPLKDNAKHKVRYLENNWRVRKKVVVIENFNQ